MCHLHHHHHLHHHRRHKNSPPPPDAMKPITRSAAAKKLKDQTVTPNTATKKKRKQSTGSVSLKPACKSRTKRRRPKYLSLNSKLDQHKKPQRSSKKNTKMTANKTRLHPQLTLFPLHPEHLVEDSKHDMHEHDDNNVVASFLFDTATDTSTTLNGLLTSTTSEQESPAASPLSLTFAYSKDRSGGDSNGLVRTAMRCKERDASEEKWVCYSEVVENKIKEEEVMSSSCTDDRDDVDEGSWCMKQVQGQQKKKKKLLLSLKLDYQEILNAWSDKGPLYIDGESPQTVPDLHDANVPMDAWSNVNGNLWSVPEMTSNDSSFNKVSDEGGCKEGWSREHREASVLRYKEKRQSRLFSKRIRYEVRKLNAEKRPRMKGRFVKRNSEL